MTDQIKDKLNHIVRVLLKKNERELPNDGTLALYVGQYGILLFFILYSKQFKHKYRHTINKYLDQLLHHLGSDIGPHSFCGGLSGILYLFEFLREKELVDVDISEVQEILENHLIAQMRKDIYERKYDFMHGALGIGLYFLKVKTHSNVINELVDFLDATAHQDEKSSGLKWISIMKVEKVDLLTLPAQLVKG